MADKPTLPNVETQYAGDTDNILTGDLVRNVDGWVTGASQDWDHGNYNLALKYEMKENMGKWVDWFLLVEIPEDKIYEELTISGGINETYQEDNPFNEVFVGIFEDIPNTPVHENIDNITGRYKIYEENIATDDFEWVEFNYNQEFYNTFEQNYLLIGITGDYSTLDSLPDDYSPEVLFYADSIETHMIDESAAPDTVYMYDVYRIPAVDCEDDGKEIENIDKDKWTYIDTVMTDEESNVFYTDNTIEPQKGYCYVIEETNEIEKFSNIDDISAMAQANISLEAIANNNAQGTVAIYVDDKLIKNVQTNEIASFQGYEGQQLKLQADPEGKSIFGDWENVK